MYLFFDTETSGLPVNYNMPATYLDNWPRIVSISWCVYNSEKQKVLERHFIIYPENVVFSREAVKVHGITLKIAREQGKDLKEVLQHFYQDSLLCSQLIAHNIDFDLRVLQAEFLRMKLPSPLHMLKPFCTMKKTTNLCRLHSKFIGQSFKWPKLQELYYFLFQKDFENAHNSLADVQACAECFFELKKRQLITGWFFYFYRFYLYS